MSDYSGFYKGVYTVGRGLGWGITKVFNTAMGNTRLQERGIRRGYGYNSEDITMASITPAIFSAMLVGASTGSITYGLVTGLLASTVPPQLQSLYLAGKHDAEQKQKSGGPDSRTP